MKRTKTRDVAHRALTNFVSMSPWPLEMSGAFVLWHYGRLFTSDLLLSSDFNKIIAQLMPGESWGALARILAYLLCGVGVLGLVTGARLYSIRLAAAIAGLVTWGVLVYSCWRNDVPCEVYEIWVGYVVIQAYVALLIKQRLREDHKDNAVDGTG